MKNTKSMRSYAIIDLFFVFFGDAGKGKTVDWLARQLPDCRNVIRFNGGSQAAHNVVLEDGFSHTFSQFGSGTLAGKSTYLTEFVSIDPIAVIEEHKHLKGYLGKDVIDKLYINLQCKVITPYHRALNRFKELKRGDTKHGSCGVGYGECINMDLENPHSTLHYSKLHNSNLIKSKLDRQKEWVLHHYPYIAEFEEFRIIDSMLEDIIWKYQCLYNSTVSVNEVMEFQILNVDDNIWEGAQGVMLDENFGTNPYTTWSTTTSDNIKTLYEKYKKSGLNVDLETIGVFRAFPTRHGKGPFPSEVKEGPINHKIFDDHNTTNDWQDALRVGVLDIPLLKYAISKCPIDSFIITHYDKLDMYNQIVLSYNSLDVIPNVASYDDSFALTKFLSTITDLTRDIVRSDEIIPLLEYELEVDCKMISTGQTHLDYLNYLNYLKNDK